MSYIPFLDLESKVAETIKREDEEIARCSQCPEYEACISGEPLAYLVLYKEVRVMRNIIWFIHRYIRPLSDKVLVKYDIFTNL